MAGGWLQLVTPDAVQSRRRRYVLQLLLALRLLVLPEQNDCAARRSRGVDVRVGASQVSLLASTLHTNFGKQCMLEDLVDPDSLRYYSAIGTNAKVVVLPQLR